MGSDITTLVANAKAGDKGAQAAFIKLFYGELIAQARRLMAGERPGHTLQTTALVHEAYFKLCRGRSLPVDSKSDFMGVAANAMKQVLVEHARNRNADKRGGGRQREELREDHSVFDPTVERERIESASRLSIDRLSEVLDTLATKNKRASDVAKRKIFLQQHNREIASDLDVSERTVQRSWWRARAWLRRHVKEDDDR